MDATISLTRPREWFGRFRRLELLVDGRAAAEVGSGETVELLVAPGPRRLQLKMDWCTSPEVEILVEAGATHRLRSRSPSVWQAPKKMRAQPESFFELLLDEEEGG